MRSQHKATKVEAVKLMAAMYAAKDFAEEAEAQLTVLRIGIVPQEMGRGVKLALGSLRDRLKELG